MDTHEKLAAIRSVMDLSYESDPETDGGYVAEVGSGLLAKNAAEQLQAAGYETSISRDDDGRYYVWVVV